MAAQRADEDHPYGHARMEYVATLAVAAIILIMGFEPVSYTHLTL